MVEKGDIFMIGIDLEAVTLKVRFSKPVRIAISRVSHINASWLGTSPPQSKVCFFENSANALTINVSSIDKSDVPKPEVLRLKVN